MIRRALVTLGLGAALALPLLAQQPADSLFRPRAAPALVKYGKWAVLAAAVGMGLKASSAHHDADRSFQRLEDYCVDDRSRCDRGPGGRYLDPVSEGYYQAALSGDRRARGWLLGGEAALLGAAGLFVWELTWPKAPPKDIPFEPSFRVIGPRTEMGLILHF